jgi:hypothetical protein
MNGIGGGDDGDDIGTFLRMAGDLDDARLKIAIAEEEIRRRRRRSDNDDGEAAEEEEEDDGGDGSRGGAIDRTSSSSGNLEGMTARERGVRDER